MSSMVGLLIMGAAILALLGVGSMWLSSGSSRQRRLRSANAESQRLPSAEPDPLDKLSLTELKQQAGQMLIAADNAVQESEQELLFASASYGEEQVSPFLDDIEKAKAHLSESFRYQHQVDREDLPEDRARELLKKVVRSCEKLNETLDSHAQEFEGLRNLERDPQPVLTRLQDQIRQLSARHGDSQQHFQQLCQKYTGAALEQYEDNLGQVQQALDGATQAASTATEKISAGEASEAVLALHSGEQGASDAQRLLESMEQTESRLTQARRNLDIGVSQTEQDIAQAQATLAAGQAADLAGPIAAAEAAVRRVKTALASSERLDPLELLQGLESAHRELDEPLNAVRDRHAKDRRARETLDHELLSARHQVQSSTDYLRSRRYGVSSTARTRMAEAQRCLSEAESLGQTQPSRAVELAQQARTLAVQAAQIVEQDQATSGMQSMGGGYGYGSGRGYGGYGGYNYGGYGYGGYGAPRRSSSARQVSRAMRTGARISRMSQRGGRRRGFF